MASPSRTQKIAADIIRIMKDHYKTRANEIAPLMGIHTHLGAAAVDVADLDAAITWLQENGMVERQPGRFIRLTQKGYGEEPSVSLVATKLLAAFRPFKLRAGDMIPKGVDLELMRQGFKGDEIADAYEALEAQGQIELRDDVPFMGRAAERNRKVS